VAAHPDYTRERIRQAARLAAARVHPDVRAPARMRITGPDGEERDAELGMPLGPLWSTWWLEVEATVPGEWAGEQLDLLLVTNSEATLWRDGEPVQGLVSGAGRDRVAATLATSAASGEALRAQVEIACSGLFGWADLNPPAQSPEPIPPAFRLERCEIARFDPDAWELAQDLGVLAALMDEEEGAWGGELLRELNRYCNTGDRTILTRLLERRNGTRTHEITAIGHAHIDTAWLWPLEETYRKCVRTFATQLRLMERYPDYRFACSQAQQYAWIRDRQPALYARIPTATSRPASRSCASSSTASASSSRSSAAAPRCSGTPTCSATTASSRSSCAVPGSAAS
jgi:alpha-mannosidase